MRRCVIPTLLAVAVAVAILAVWWGPWLSMPGEPVASIDARWAEIERLAPVGQERAGDSWTLQAACDGLDPARPALEGLVGRGPGEPIPRLAVDALPAEARTALALLAAWHRTGTACMEPCGKFPVLKVTLLFRLALSVATDAPDDPSLAAALHLAQSMRLNGGSLAELVGARLARQAAQWAAQGHPGAVALLRKYRPLPDEVAPAAARFSTCPYRLVVEHLAGLERIGPFARFSDDVWRSVPPFGLVRPEREAAWARKALADRFDAVRSPDGGVAKGSPDERCNAPSVMARLYCLSDMERDLGRDVAEEIAQFDKTLAAIEASPK